MKRNLIEQLERIHRLNYGNNVINESDLWDKIIGLTGVKRNAVDSKKADVVSDDVSAFYKNLEDAAKGNGITQQERGSMSFQKEVESMQIGLILLGYELPKHGVDGLFGPETSEAVSKFTSEKVNSGTKTAINELFVRLGDTSYSNVKFDKDGTQNDQLNQALLDDLQTAASKADVVVTITTAKSGHSDLTVNGKASRHATNTAVDIAVLDGIGAGGATNETNGNPRFRELGNRVQKELLNMGYALNAEGGNQKAVLWQTNTGGNHYNHLHVSNKEGVSGSAPSEKMTKATPEMLNKLIELLKEKGIKSEDITPYINKSNSGGGGSVTVNDWEGVVNLIIDKLEGGYYHPDMLLDGRVKDGRFGNSGETMYGLDRKAGNIEATGAAGREFWSLIDAENARSNWKHNYMLKDNPTLDKQLRRLAAEIMKPLFIRNSKAYLSPESAEIISKDAALTFNFGYATWNGPGWFQKFAKVMNDEVASGNKDPKSLLQAVLSRRTESKNSLISQGGSKVANIANRISSTSTMA